VVELGRYKIFFRNLEEETVDVEATSTNTVNDVFDKSIENEGIYCKYSKHN